MISDAMQKRLNEHLNVELFAAYSYFQMAAYCRFITMNGFAHWLQMQAQEELGHAMKFYQYLDDQDREVKLLAIKEPKSDYTSLVEVFEGALKHEQAVTAKINELVAASIKEGDHTTQVFLQWFVTEQLEEEAHVRDLLDQLKLVKDSGEGLLILDRELAGRTSGAG